MLRLKPQGKDWQQFVNTWIASEHDEKLDLARRYGVTYDTAKHWVSEGDTTMTIKAVEKPVGAVYGMDMPDCVGEILMTQPKMKLDFVSFDLETTDLTADFGIILTACIKPYGQDPIMFRHDDYPNWKDNKANDSALLNDIARELSKHAVVITHYGARFDIPYMRAKMIKYGMAPLPPMFGVDTWQIARQTMATSRRRLETLGKYLELGSKSGVEGNLWIEAGLNGSKKAMDAIVAHNIVDCEILEKLACITFPYLRAMKRL